MATKAEWALVTHNGVQQKGILVTTSGQARVFLGAPPHAIVETAANPFNVQALRLQLPKSFENTILKWLPQHLGTVAGADFVVASSDSTESHFVPFDCDAAGSVTWDNYDFAVMDCPVRVIPVKEYLELREGLAQTTVRVTSKSEVEYRLKKATPQFTVTGDQLLSIDGLLADDDDDPTTLHLNRGQISTIELTRDFVNVRWGFDSRAFDFAFAAVGLCSAGLNITSMSLLLHCIAASYITVSSTQQFTGTSAPGSGQPDVLDFGTVTQIIVMNIIGTVGSLVQCFVALRHAIRPLVPISALGAVVVGSVLNLESVLGVAVTSSSSANFLIGITNMILAVTRKGSVNGYGHVVALWACLMVTIVAQSISTIGMVSRNEAIRKNAVMGRIQDACHRLFRTLTKGESIGLALSKDPTLPEADKFSANVARLIANSLELKHALGNTTTQDAEKVIDHSKALVESVASVTSTIVEIMPQLNLGTPQAKQLMLYHRLVLAAQVPCELLTKEVNAAQLHGVTSV